MRTKDEIEEINMQFVIYQDTYGDKKMGPEKAKMWKSQLDVYPVRPILTAFTEMFRTQKYAFQLVDLLPCVDKYATEHTNPHVVKDLPSMEESQEAQNMLQDLRRNEKAYKDGKISFEEFSATMKVIYQTTESDDGHKNLYEQLKEGVEAHIEALRGYRKTQGDPLPPPVPQIDLTEALRGSEDDWK